MFTQIMVPVDIAHEAKLERSLKAAAGLAKLYHATVCYVGVTAETPGPLGHNPAEYAQHLDAFTQRQVDAHGHTARSVAYASHDPSIDLSGVLLRASQETGADLIVMESHVPGVADHLWPSHGGQVARKASVSVMLVR